MDAITIPTLSQIVNEFEYDELEQFLVPWCHCHGGLAFDAAEKIRACLYQRSSSLELACLDLEDLPDCWHLFPLLEELHLFSNELTSLPDSMQYLCGLQELDISENQLTDLPAWLVDFSSLQSLDLRGNALSPQARGVLHQIRYKRADPRSFGG